MRNYEPLEQDGKGLPMFPGFHSTVKLIVYRFRYHKDMYESVGRNDGKPTEYSGDKERLQYLCS